MLRAATARMGDEAVKGMVARTPLGRLGTTSDVADVVAFIASPDARWVTGQVVEASGGINPGASSVPAFVKQTFTAKMLGKALAAKSAAEVVTRGFTVALEQFSRRGC